MSRRTCPRSAVIGNLLAILPLVPVASAQYAFDRSRDGHEERGTRYFGSAKDAKGTRLADVTFVIDSPQATFSFVTDATGRFSGLAPVEIAAGASTARCVKAGFQQVRVERRAGPKSRHASMQIDCVLRPVAS